MGLVRRCAGLALVLTLGACSAGGSATDASTTTTTPATTPTTPTTPTTTPTTTTVPIAFDLLGLETLLEDLADRGAYSGVVLVGSGDDVVWTFASGSADREEDIAVRVDTRFNLMSATKMFTAVGILQLVDQGRVALDGTIADYLPDYPNGPVAAEVTIEQLLTHTSGLGDVFTEEFGADPNAYRANADYLPLFVDTPLQFPPGREFAYSNAGFVVLGLIIEEVSGQDYYDYIREHVFDPAGMGSSGFPFVEDASDDLAVGYTTRDIDGNETGILAPHTALMPGRGFAAGGSYSTAGDLHRFAAALFGHRLTSPESVEALTTGRVELREDAKYALGFFDRVQSGRRVIGHGGGAPGGCTSLGYYPATGTTIVVLSNSDADCFAVLDFLAENPPH